jgi:RHS repeat-associated protein
VTRQANTVVSRHDYLPFGEEIPSNLGGRSTSLGYQANANLTHRFTGKERDTETTLDYFGARYLSSAQGRWTSPDGPFIDQITTNPQSWSLYSYTRNSPLRYVDEDGQLIKEAQDLARETAKRVYVVSDAAAKQGLSFAARSLSVGLGILFWTPAANAPTLEDWRAARNQGNDQQTQDPQPTQSQEPEPTESKSAEPEPATDGAGARKGGGKGERVDTRATKAEKNTLSGALDQRESISKAQAKLKKAGKPEMIRSIDKSKQRERNQLRRIRTLEDVEQENNNVP